MIDSYIITITNDNHVKFKKKKTIIKTDKEKLQTTIDKRQLIQIIICIQKSA